MESLVQKTEQSEHIQLQDGRKTIQQALTALHGLSLLRTVIQDQTVQVVLDLLRKLVEPDTRPEALASAYSSALRELATLANDETLPHLSDVWQACLAARLIDDSNPWSSQVEQVGSARVSSVLRQQARRELRVLQALFLLDARMLRQMVEILVVPTLPTLQGAWQNWIDLAPYKEEERFLARQQLVASMAASADWSALVEELEHHWSLHGTGPQAHYTALRWSGGERQLLGIARPDSVQLAHLVGQERQQQRLTTNIERFLAGLPAQHMLLYGPPGTGKSSTVKALVNAYAASGLRLVEISKNDIADLSLVVAQLRRRSPHYLLFIDDLSFEEHETSYKGLKVLLEGTAESRPANILICATSNRLNLVRENFSERGKPTEDITWRDTMDEKQSLAHRFALRITFLSPDQREYLHIVEQIARQRNLDIAPELLQERALHWERQHTGRSGRLARQFIDDLEAEVKHRTSAEAGDHHAPLRP